MGRLPIERPESRGLAATWKDEPGMLGVRMTFSRDPHRAWLFDGTADWFWEAAERHSIPVMVFAPGFAPEIGEVAIRHPGLRLVIDHLRRIPFQPYTRTFAASWRRLVRSGCSGGATSLVCPVPTARLFPCLPRSWISSPILTRSGLWGVVLRLG